MQDTINVFFSGVVHCASWFGCY